MSVDDLFAEASRRGIHLAAREGRLIYDAPPDVMDLVFRASLLASKAELLARLENRGAPARPTPPDAPLAEPWRPRPLHWRAVTITWTIPRRERWGRLANQFAEEGIPFPEDERRAFVVVDAEDSLPTSGKPR